MTSYLASKVGKHILKENAKNNFGREDPFFDYVTPHDLDGNPGKVKKTKKAAPPGITAAEAKILKKVTRRAYRLDNCFSICGFRIGWSAIFAIIPGLGDVFDAFMAMMVYRTICQADVPASLRSRMLINIVADFAIGLVPFIGDIADSLFKANTMNAGLLYNHLRDRGAARIKAGGAIEPSAAGDKVGIPLREQSTNHGNASARTQTLQKPAPSLTKQQQKQQQRNSLISPAIDTKDHHPQGQTSGTIAVDSTRAQAEAAAAETGINTKDDSKPSWYTRFGGGRGSIASLTAKTREPDLEAGEGEGAGV